MDETSKQPRLLHGVKVIELGALIAGPYAGGLFAHGPAAIGRICVLQAHNAGLAASAAESQSWCERFLHARLFAFSAFQRSALAHL
ncbi:MAG: hypothetical protein JWP34_2944 [Massilia sp.]|nr:hypothetical protein [Massilia sp.]